MMTRKKQMRYAVKMDKEWFVCQRMNAGEHGKPTMEDFGSVDVWVIVQTTALLGLVGDEQRVIELD